MLHAIAMRTLAACLLCRLPVAASVGTAGMVHVVLRACLRRCRHRRGRPCRPDRTGDQGKAQQQGQQDARHVGWGGKARAARYHRKPRRDVIAGVSGRRRGESASVAMKWRSRSQRAWVAAAIRKIEADFNRSADTHLIPLDLPGFPGIDVYLKDESSHPTGSLKHRLARSLFLYALANGWLREGCPVIEASSGSTA